MPSCDSPSMGACACNCSIEKKDCKEKDNEIKALRKKLRKALQENRRLKDILAEREIRKSFRKIKRR